MEIRIRTIDEFRSERVTVEVAPGQRAEIEIVDGEVSKREHLFTSDEVVNAQASEAALVAGPLKKRINDLEEKLVKERIRANALERQVKRFVEPAELDRAERQRNEYAAQMDAQELKIRELENGRQADHQEIAELRRQRDEAEKSLAESRELVAFKNRVLNKKDDEIRRLDGKLNAAESKLMKGHVCTSGCTENSHMAFVGRQALVKLENQVAELARRIDNARVILSAPSVTGALNRAVRDQEESQIMAAAIENALALLA